jgi:hypothetical protein
MIQRDISNPKTMHFAFDKMEQDGGEGIVRPKKIEHEKKTHTFTVPVRGKVTKDGTIF